MGLYYYEVKDMHGVLKKGKIHGETEEEVYEKLRLRKTRVLSLIEAPETLANKEITLLKPKIKSDSLVEYLQQLSMLVNAGIGVLDANKMLVEGTKGKVLKKAISSICLKLEEGQSFSAALEAEEGLFPQLMISLIKASELSGSLDVNLKKLAIYYEKRNKSRKKVISALIYPAILLLLSLAVSIFLMVAIVPMFVQLFDDFDSELPKITQITLAISETLKYRWWLILLIIAIVIVAYKLAMQVPRLRYKRDELMLKVPLFGNLIAIDSLSLIFSTMASLLSSSVRFSKTLDISQEVVPNLVMKQVLVDAKINIEQGGSLSESFIESPFVPIHTSQMIQVGEATGNLDGMLQKLSEIYEEEVEMMSERIKTVLEPMIIIVIAVLIGFIVAAIMLPMFAMYDAIQG